MTNAATLIVRTAMRRYAVRRDDVQAIRLIGGAADLEAGDGRNPYIGVELGPLLDPNDRSTRSRRHALIVPLRRRFVALLVDHIETFQEQASIAALPALLAAQLRQPWAIGAVEIDTELLVQLDLRAVARTALAQRSDMG
jgi:hypothetical protein